MPDHFLCVTRQRGGMQEDLGCIVYGLWLYGLGCMVVWFGVYGLWFRVYGLWFMVRVKQREGMKGRFQSEAHTPWLTPSLYLP